MTDEIQNLKWQLLAAKEENKLLVERNKFFAGLLLEAFEVLGRPQKPPLDLLRRLATSGAF